MNQAMKVTKMSAILCAVLLLLVTVGCSSKFKHQVEKTKHGVTIHHDSTNINITVINESIIRINKIMNGSTPSTIPDYVTVLEPQDVSWNLDTTEDLLTIRTDNLKVLVHSDGKIEYQNKDNKKLLAETKENTFIKQDTTAIHAVSQAFHAGDEALYGLGQFQSGIMNWKNVPIRLQQYNQEIAIPFLVSTNSYGIYWNNYSITDFNLPANEIEFATVPKKEIVTDTKVESSIEKENVAAYASALNEEKNIRETTFTPTKTGEYYFMALSDEGGKMRGEIKVTIDGEDVISYSTIWVPTRYSGKKYLEAGKEYKVVFQNTGAKIPGNLYYNEPDFNKTVFSSLAGNAIDYYFVYGEKPSDVITEYQHLTGNAPMFPKSAYGFWQCRERYHNQEELLENASEMRARKIPFDNIVQDWFYWPEGMKGPEWDRTKYPDPKAMVDSLRKLNIRLMVSVWPEVKHEPLEKKYNLTKVKGSAKLDFYDTGVQERFYRMLSDSMFHIGVNSIWLDGTEPAGKSSKDIKTAVGPNDEVYNAYSLLVTKSMYEGRREEFPMQRVFNLTRSAYAGQQRYGAASWSGDVQSTWKQFAEQIPAGLNFTMAGVPYWTHDIGGFFRDSKSLNPIYDDQYTNPEYIELLTRWFQFGTFSPIFRIHGYVSETEIWRYGQEFEDTARKFIDLRYLLMPYIYSEARKVNADGKLLMAPLVYQYPTDKNTWEIKDQLLFGESMMAGFVTEYQKREKEMYFPKGDWYNFWTSEKIEGGRNISVKAPLDETPLYVKAGSIIPMSPPVQYATERTEDPMEIRVYPGKDAEYVMYLDDNESYNYEKGMYSEVIITYSEKNKTLKIKKGYDQYMRFPDIRMLILVTMVGSDKYEEFFFDGTEKQIKF
ncbi:glycoside hydrolase family 31 protein [Mariniflexile gromovii]